MQRLIIIAIIVAFLADLIYKNIYEENSNNNPDIQNTKEQDLPPFIPNSMNYIKKPIHFIDYDEIFYDDSEEQFSQILNEINPTINITITYDPKNYKTNIENITNLLYKDYSNFIISNIEHEISSTNKRISNILFYSQITISVLFMGLSYIKSYLTFLPEKLLDFIIGFKLFFTAGSFLLHRHLIQKYSSTYAFEVFVNGKQIYSALEIGKAPLYEDIIRILANMKIYRN